MRCIVQGTGPVPTPVDKHAVPASVMVGMHICMCVRVLMYACTYSYTCMDTQMHTHTHARTHTHTHTHTHSHTHTHTHTHAHTHACTHAHTHLNTACMAANVSWHLIQETFSVHRMFKSCIVITETLSTIYI